MQMACGADATHFWGLTSENRTNDAVPDFYMRTVYGWLARLAEHGANLSPKHNTKLTDTVTNMLKFSVKAPAEPAQEELDGWADARQLRHARGGNARDRQGDGQALRRVREGCQAGDGALV